MSSLIPVPPIRSLRGVGNDGPSGVRGGMPFGNAGTNQGTRGGRPTVRQPGAVPFGIVARTGLAPVGSPHPWPRAPVPGHGGLPCSRSTPGFRPIRRNAALPMRTAHGSGIVRTGVPRETAWRRTRYESETGTDGQRFDDLTKSLATGASRRRVLRGIMGVAGGAFGLAVGRSAGAATLRPAGATCIRDAQCASADCDPATRRCVAPVPPPNEAPCTGSAECASGNCTGYDGDPETATCCDPGASGCNGICCPSGTSCEPGQQVDDPTKALAAGAACCAGCSARPALPASTAPPTPATPPPASNRRAAPSPAPAIAPATPPAPTTSATSPSALAIPTPVTSPAIAPTWAFCGRAGAVGCSRVGCRAGQQRARLDACCTPDGGSRAGSMDCCTRSFRIGGLCNQGASARSGGARVAGGGEQGHPHRTHPVGG